MMTVKQAAAEDHNVPLYKDASLPDNGSQLASPLNSDTFFSSPIDISVVQSERGDDGLRSLERGVAEDEPVRSRPSSDLLHPLQLFRRLLLHQDEILQLPHGEVREPPPHACFALRPAFRRRAVTSAIGSQGPVVSHLPLPWRSVDGLQKPN